MQPRLPDAKIRCQLHVRGIVQGVGFRPFVYKLATSLGLTGFVFNSSSGVTIEIEGSSQTSRTFIDRLERDPPQLAEIRELTSPKQHPWAASASRFSRVRGSPRSSPWYLQTPAHSRLAGATSEAADFDLAAARRNIHSVRPGMQTFEVSTKTGSGMPEVLQFLRDQLARSRETLAALQTESTV